MINPVAVAAAGTNSIASALSGAAKPAGGQAFSGVLTQAMQDMHKLERDAATKVHGLLSGDGVDVHAAMIATERADSAFEMALAVRNKAVAAYQQLSSMQF